MTNDTITMGDVLRIDPRTQDLLFREARTANAFTNEPVTADEIRAVHDLVRWGPTAMNTTPLRVVAVEPGAARDRLVSSMNPGNRAKTAAAPMTLILAADVDFHAELPRLFPAKPDARDLFGDETAREATARAGGMLQAGYWIVGLRAAGLAVGPMGGFDAAAVERDFFPDGRHRALLVVNVGHPAADAYYPRAPRLDVDEVVTVA